jgi:hypothetical protein
MYVGGRKTAVKAISLIIVRGPLLLVPYTTKCQSSARKEPTLIHQTRHKSWPLLVCESPTLLANRCTFPLARSDASSQGRSKVLRLLPRKAPLAVDRNDHIMFLSAQPH